MSCQYSNAYVADIGGYQENLKNPGDALNANRRIGIDPDGTKGSPIRGKRGEKCLSDGELWD